MPNVEFLEGQYCLYYAFYGSGLTGALDLSSLKRISGGNSLIGAFGNTSITSVDLSGLVGIGYGGAYDASLALSEAFRGTNLTTVTFDSLSVMGANQCMASCFSGCTSLASLSFPALTASSFGTQTNQFNGMLYGCTGVTVHFPAAIQSTIGSWASVTGGFGGTNTTVLFDL